MTGIASLFPNFPRVNIVLTRHKHNYFKDWTDQQLDEAGMDNITRPLQPITSELYSTNVKKNEVTRNKKLQYCMTMAASDDSPAWATQFLDNLESGVIKSITEAKDQASTLWRQHSTAYDNRRAVQVPSSEPNGHATKRKRRDDESEYQYRKRINTQPEQEPEISDDPNIAVALSVKSSLKYIMSLKKNELQQKISENKETAELLKKEGHLPTKTTEDLRLSLMTIAVYEHLNS